MTKNVNKVWYRFIDKNRAYDYKSLYNAVTWAEMKVQTSTSGEIRIIRFKRLSRGGFELEVVAFTRLNRSGSITTAWKNIDVYREYKEKEGRVRSQESEEGRDTEGDEYIPGSDRAA